jgi:hypothetical protein
MRYGGRGNKETTDMGLPNKEFTSPAAVTLGPSVFFWMAAYITAQRFR